MGEYAAEISDPVENQPAAPLDCLAPGVLYGTGLWAAGVDGLFFPVHPIDHPSDVHALISYLPVHLWLE